MEAALVPASAGAATVSGDGSGKLCDFCNGLRGGRAQPAPSSVWVSRPSLVMGELREATVGACAPLSPAPDKGDDWD